MKLCTSTSDLIKELKKTDECIRAISKTGFRLFNVCFDDEENNLKTPEAWDDYILRIKTALEETGTSAPLAHSLSAPLQYATYEQILESTWKDIRACETLGIPDIVVHPIFDNRLGARETLRLNKQFYTDVYAGVPGTNVHVLIENSADTEGVNVVFQSGQDLREFLEYMDHPLMGACWDTSHCNLSRQSRNNQYDSIIALGDKLRSLHIADNYGLGAHHHTFPLAGVINFDSVMCALLDINYQGVFNFEASYTIRAARQMPMPRNKWTHPTDPNFVPRVESPSADLKLKAEELLYEIGKFLLEQYGVYEG